MDRSRAFTLIELLVVIAIIGILASVVLSSLDTARLKGRDAAVKGNMNTIATQAGMYNSNNSTYGDTGGVNDCTLGMYSDSTIQTALAAIDVATQNAPRACYANGDDFAVAVTRPSNAHYTPNSTYWCADSAGKKCGINDLTPLTGSACGCP